MIARPRGLNYEARRVHTLTIEATDQATPANLQRFSTAVVIICSTYSSIIYAVSSLDYMYILILVMDMIEVILVLELMK